MFFNQNKFTKLTQQFKFISVESKPIDLYTKFSELFSTYEKKLFKGVADDPNVSVDVVMNFSSACNKYKEAVNLNTDVEQSINQQIDLIGIHLSQVKNQAETDFCRLEINSFNDGLRKYGYKYSITEQNITEELWRTTIASAILFEQYTIRRNLLITEFQNLQSVCEGIFLSLSESHQQPALTTEVELHLRQRCVALEADNCELKMKNSALEKVLSMITAEHNIIKAMENYASCSEAFDDVEEKDNEEHNWVKITKNEKQTI